MTTSATATYRKTKQGEWVVMAPVSMLNAGSEVRVFTKAGASKYELIERVGKAFDVNGQPFAYGYIAAKTARGYCAPKTPKTTASHSAGGTCDNCGERSSRLVEKVDSSGLGGSCCPTCARSSRYELSFA